MNLKYIKYYFSIFIILVIFLIFLTIIYEKIICFHSIIFFNHKLFRYLIFIKIRI